MWVTCRGMLMFLCIVSGCSCQAPYEVLNTKDPKLSFRSLKLVRTRVALILSAPWLEEHA